MLDVKLSVPDKTLVALKLDPEGLADEIRLAAAVKLYELGRLSAGAAAELAGIPLPAFLSKLADYGVSAFRMTAEELEALALGAESPGALVILDDMLARKHAALLGLAFTGTLGVLIKAKRSGLLPALLPVIDRLHQLRFRMGPEPRAAALKLAGE